MASRRDKTNFLNHIPKAILLMIGKELSGLLKEEEMTEMISLEKANKIEEDIHEMHKMGEQDEELSEEDEDD